MYYQGSSEIQADGLQTLYLMNPNYIGYSDTHPPPQSNLLAASATHALSSSLMTHAPPQQFVGIPLSHDPSRPSHQDHIQAVHSNTIPRFHYNVWGLVDQSTNGNQTNMPQQTPRGLSLSLSAAHHLNSGDQDFPVQSSVGMISPRICSSPSLTTTESNGVNTVLIGSKYLKAAQELLDEVAHVGKEMNSNRPETARNKAKMVKDSAAINVSSGEGGEGGGKNGGAELTTAQRQEIQMKKAKLISMLDEVEQRCRQYHQEMQIVVSSFEQAAGIGSARSYTHLALKTIMKQFKCLKSTISSQIKALNKSLGEEEIPDKKLEGSRLKFIDNQIRQQRALQELRMMQNNAWRPQRGLPERAVSVLRAWLFEHFLHPKTLTATSSDARKRCARYPKDSDKQMLAKQTGLTRSQVSNWFINARVRLWKPMVEEMYLEETKNQEQDNNSTLQENPTHQLHSNSIDAQQESINPPTKIPASTGGFAQLISSLNLEKNPKKPRNDTDSPSSILSAEMDVKVGDSSKGFSNYLSSMAAANHATRYGIGDQQLATGFHGNNNFSLSLALPPTETSQGLHQQNFLSSFEFGTRIEPGNVESSSRINQAVDSHSSIGYEILDFQNRKPFPAQLLPDFVA